MGHLPVGQSGVRDSWGGAGWGWGFPPSAVSHRSRSSSSSSRTVALLSSPKLSLEGPEPWTGLSSGVRAAGSGLRAGGWNLRLYRLVMSICRAVWTRKRGRSQCSFLPLLLLLPAPSGGRLEIAPVCRGPPPSPFSCSSTSVCPKDTSTPASCSSLPCKCFRTSCGGGGREHQQHKSDVWAPLSHPHHKMPQPGLPDSWSSTLVFVPPTSAQPHPHLHAGRLRL